MPRRTVVETASYEENSDFNSTEVLQAQCWTSLVKTVTDASFPFYNNDLGVCRRHKSNRTYSTKRGGFCDTTDIAAELRNR